MTGERNTIQEVLEADEMRQALISSSPLPIVVIAATGEILLWNEAAERAFGWTASEVLGRPLPFIPSERQDEHRAMRQRDLSGQGFTGREIRRKRRDGTWMELSLSTAPLHDKAGAVSGTLCIYVDITERKQAQKELERQARELARSNADLQQFAHAVSHDLQEPLRAISSYAELLRRRAGPELDEGAQEFLEYIVNGSHRMNALIRGLLTYSRAMEAEQSGFRLVDLRAVIQEALTALSLAIQESHATVTVAENVPEIEGHPGALTQLILNLVSNAIKYRKPAVAPDVKIGFKLDDDVWIFSVADNGIGIEPSYHDKIFFIFERLDPANSPGTGLGLALCQKIVERHGGRIWVQSAPSEGSTFYFTLPIRKSTGT